jgi:RHS repeat-associated protein
VAVIEGGVVSYIRTDHIGRPVFATNTTTGVQTWTASPARAGVRGRSSGKQSTGLFSDPPHPFGGVRTVTGAPISVRFPGQWFQAESGLHQNWMRDYDPTTGRYLQAAPLGLVDGAPAGGPNASIMQNAARHTSRRTRRRISYSSRRGSSRSMI